MRSRQFGYWSEERLDELERLFPILSPTELKVHFKKAFYLIQNAYEFRLRSRPMVEEIIIENGITITRYRAAYAEGTGKQLGSRPSYTNRTLTDAPMKQPEMRP